MSDKKELRRLVRAGIAQMDSCEKEKRSMAICEEVEKYLAESAARVIALFSPLGDEPLIWPLVEQMSKSLSVVLPRVEGDIMNFYTYDKEAMSVGAFGINEPRTGVSVSPCDIDAIIVPGVAFTACGARMGRGKGFYDKYLSQDGFSALKIGVCFSEQIVDHIPVEQHDVAMDVVIYK
ncbi:MAG: 5-formyltetrahydrofolate cyclo-ligase [Bacteroidaceae bacterium]|nr:5-formyltetrahydrofolate cyclo-ligase [Bacteroidaceae bacterium]